MCLSETKSECYITSKTGWLSGPQKESAFQKIHTGSLFLSHARIPKKYSYSAYSPRSVSKMSISSLLHPFQQEKPWQTKFTEEFCLSGAERSLLNLSTTWQRNNSRSQTGMTSLTNQEWKGTKRQNSVVQSRDALYVLWALWVYLWLQTVKLFFIADSALFQCCSNPLSFHGLANPISF